MDYKELYNTIRKRLYDVLEVSDTINVNKLITYIETEEAKMYVELPNGNDDLPF